MNRFLSISIILLSIAVAFLINLLSTFEGGPHHGVRPIPREAVPIWRTTELHWFVRYFMGYLLGVIAPLSTMTNCATVVDWGNKAEAEAAQLCMKRARSVEDMDAATILLKSLFDEEIIFIDRHNGGDPMRVILLKKQNSSRNKSKAPLILHMHGGGFTARGNKNALSARIFTALLGMDDETSPVMEGATWAIVDYRIAPDFIYPAATDDCILALNHLVHIMGLGEGGIHVAGISAGGTLAIETTMKSIELVDTFYVDEPVVPLPLNDQNDEWSMDSPSFRRYAYTRIPSVTWLEWSLKAYTGVGTVPNLEKDLTYGAITTSVDITGGAMTVSEWVKRSNSTDLLPPLFLVTAKGDPLQYGGLEFKGVYEQAIKQVEAKNNKHESTPEDISKIKHFDTSSGHTGFYFFEPSVFQYIMKEWHDAMCDVWERKNRVVPGQ
ncbi:hypothetical protein ACHAXR_004207 [Thalassiosira sp. AJA248-18]